MTNGPTINPVKASLRDVLFVIFSKLHVFIGTLIIIVVIVIGYSFLTSPIYEVSASILVKPFVDSSLQLQTATSQRVFPVSLEDLNSEIKIMTSEELIRRIVKELALDRYEEPTKLLPKLKKKFSSILRDLGIWLGISYKGNPTDAAVAKLRSQLKIEPVTMSYIIRISLKGTDPARITKTVNTFIDRYIDYHIEVHKAKGGISFYSQQAELYSKKLRAAENALNEFIKKWSIIEIQSQRAANIDLLKILQETLSLVRGKIAEKESKLSQLNENLQQRGEVTVMTDELRGSHAIVELTKAMVPLLVEAERTALLYPKSTDKYQDAFIRLERLKEDLRKEQTQVLSGIELDVKALMSHEKTLSEEIRSIQTESQLLSERETEWERLVREVEQNKKNYILYLDKTEEARISDQKDASRVANVTVASWAQTPSVPVFPRKVLMGFISIIVGVISGIGCAFAAYYLDHTVKQPEDLDRECQIKVLSSLEKIEPR